MVTLDYPVADVSFKTTSASFLEDWRGTGVDARRVHFRNGYKHKLRGEWMPFSAASVHVNREERCRMYVNAYDTGVLEDTSFYLQSGGKTVPSEKALEKVVNLDVAWPQSRTPMSRYYCHPCDAQIAI